MTGDTHCRRSFFLKLRLWQAHRSDAADVTIATAFFSGGIMRHPALRRSARHSSKREARAEAAKATAQTAAPDQPAHDPAAQNRPAPGTQPDGEHNQGGARKEGIDYQRDLGSEQDA